MLNHNIRQFSHRAGLDHNPKLPIIPTWAWRTMVRKNSKGKTNLYLLSLWSLRLNVTLFLIFFSQTVKGSDTFKWIDVILGHLLTEGFPVIMVLLNHVFLLHLSLYWTYILVPPLFFILEWFTFLNISNIYSIQARYNRNLTEYPRHGFLYFQLLFYNLASLNFWIKICFVFFYIYLLLDKNNLNTVKGELRESLP